MNEIKNKLHAKGYDPTKVVNEGTLTVEAKKMNSVENKIKRKKERHTEKKSSARQNLTVA